MKTYDYAEAGEDLAGVLDEARKEGAVRIRSESGEAFLITPDTSPGSPLDVPGVKVGISTAEWIDAVRESRGRRDR